jgi:protein tyrosine phosphatase (PTP) superfamily phosphohydrolase (DUF442 family)
LKTSSSLPLAAAAALLAPLFLACSADGSKRSHVAEESAPEPTALGEVTYDEEGFPHGLHHFRRWSPRIAQGGGPEDGEAFANLARLGYRTVLSVDGARPKVELAEQHGLRYVHVPIGYDGITPDQALRIVKAVEGSEGPVYIHCHHGKHRGPAAAQVARIAIDGVDNDEAVEDLRVSGCSPDYPGLYRTVERFHAPAAEALAQVGPLPSEVVPTGLRALMAEIDERWDFVKASRAAAWAVPPRYPDIDPPHEVGMIENWLRETIDLEQRGEAREEFLAHAREAQQAASSLESALGAGERERADAAYEQLSASCKACHSTYRD